MADTNSFTFPVVKSPNATSIKNPLLFGATVTNATRQGQEHLAGAQAATMPPPEDVSRPKQYARTAASGLGRNNKIPLEKGFSQMGWVRLQQSNADLAGVGPSGPRQGISLEEVARHCTKDDAWMVLRGKVYNITRYISFHPGGAPQLMRAVGKDGTVLFNKYHSWVNADFLLAKCLVGTLEG